jgi:hypothetical protein
LGYISGIEKRIIKLKAMLSMAKRTIAPSVPKVFDCAEVIHAG